MKPFADSCEENKQPILQVLKIEFARATSVLEIGSGTGQHAVHFARNLPHLIWQTSDLAEMHQGINQWIQEAGLKNVKPPMELDVRHGYTGSPVEAVFSANTVHIISWPEVQSMFSLVARALSPGGVFCLYGPFNYGGKFTSPSNARFNDWLKARDSKSGIRDFAAVEALAVQRQLLLVGDYSMPVNNRMLVWRKDSPGIGAGP